MASDGGACFCDLPTQATSWTVPDKAVIVDATPLRPVSSKMAEPEGESELIDL